MTVLVCWLVVVDLVYLMHGGVYPRQGSGAYVLTVVRGCSLVTCSRRHWGAQTICDVIFP
eukprot:11853281-Prorocentrum_lima.AAC.1